MTTTVETVAIYRQRNRKASPASKFWRALRLVGIVSAISSAIAMSAPGLAVSIGLYAAVKSALTLGSRKLFKTIHRRLKKVYPESGELLRKIEPDLDKLQKLPWLAFFLGGGIWSAAESPANAQFFGAAEDFFTATFEVDEAVIGIVFGILRALFLLYLAIALIGIINAARNDQDWQTAARTPLMVAVTVAIGEVLTNMIVGEGGGGGGAP